MASRRPCVRVLELTSALFFVTCVWHLVSQPACTVGNPRVQALRAPERPVSKTIVSPSVAKANFWNLGEDLSAAVEGGAEWLHFSVQDGRMVPKVSFGSPVIKACRAKLPDTVFDVKLGVINPEDRIKEFASAGADIISVHPEATLQLPAVLNLIDESGCAPGVILNPATPLSAVEHVLDFVDIVVVMLVNPGWGGPKYMDVAVEKIKQLRAMRPSIFIEVDGGVSTKNAKMLLDAGANVLVAGGSVFTADDKREAINALLSSGA